MDGHLLRYNKNVVYAFCDLETFNLNLNWKYNRPWQVGILKVRGEQIIDGRDIRIKIPWKDAPFLDIGREAAIITKFDRVQHDKMAVEPEEAFKRFWPVLKDADYIIMHNGLKFDLYLLRGYAQMMGEDWKWIMPKIIDTKSIAHGIKMNIKYHPKDGSFMEYQYRMANASVKGIKTRLEILGRENNIDHAYDNLHDAIVDLELNLKVWNILKRQVEI